MPISNRLTRPYGPPRGGPYSHTKNATVAAVVIHPPATTKVLQGLGGRGPPKVGPVLKPGAMG